MNAVLGRLACIAALFGACLMSIPPAQSQSLQPAAAQKAARLQVAVTGLPSGSSFALTLAGPSPRTVTVSGAVTLRALKAGRYSWSASKPVTVDSRDWAAAPASGSFVVAPGRAAKIAIAFSAKDSAPNAPTQVSVEARYQEATVTWLPPTDVGISRITEYVVTASPVGGSGSARVATATWDANSSSWPSGEGRLEFGGFDTSATYTFTVVARNAAGDSPPSEPSQPVALGPNIVEFCQPVRMPNGISVTMTSITNRNSGGMAGYPSVRREMVNTTSARQDVGLFWLVYPSGKTQRWSNSRSDYMNPGATSTIGMTLPFFDIAGLPLYIVLGPLSDWHWYSLPKGDAPYWRVPSVAPGETFDCSP